MSVIWKRDWRRGKRTPGDIVLNFGDIDLFLQNRRPMVYARIVKDDGWLSNDDSPWEGPIPPIDQALVESGRQQLLEYTGEEISEADILGWLARYKETDGTSLMTADIATGDRNARDAQGGVDA